MKYTLLLAFFLIGCTTNSYHENAEECFKVMRKNSIPICQDLDSLTGMSKYEYGFEIGHNVGFFNGCMATKTGGEVGDNVETREGD